jgi:hypothetical protein
LSAAAFEAMFVTQPLFKLRRSKLTPENVTSLQEWGVMSKVNRERVKHTISYFQVVKKDGRDRLIGDARPINDAQVSPQKMPLADMRDLLAQIAKFSFGGTVDAVSFFYQFSFVNGAYFALANNEKRGAPTYFCPDVPPMGWKHMPNIAQRTSRAVVGEVRRRLQNKNFFLEVWIDNFIFATTSAQDLLDVQHTLMEVCKEASIHLHPPVVIEGGKRMEFLGVSFDLNTREFSQSESWKESTQDILRNMTLRQPTYRTTAALIGKLLWAIHIRSLPLCTFHQLVEMSRVTALNIRDGASWDDLFPVPHETIHSIFIPVLDAMLRPHRVHFLRPEPTVLFCSDAFTNEEFSTWAVTSGDFVESGTFERPINIFFAELFAAARALTVASTLSNRVILNIDNSAVLFALHNGHSANPTADRILHLLLSHLPSSFAFAVTHVHSDFNEADTFTREKVNVLSRGAPLQIGKIVLG